MVDLRGVLFDVTKRLAHFYNTYMIEHGERIGEQVE